MFAPTKRSYGQTQAANGRVSASCAQWTSLWSHQKTEKGHVAHVPVLSWEGPRLPQWGCHCCFQNSTTASSLGPVVLLHLENVMFKNICTIEKKLVLNSLQKEGRQLWCLSIWLYSSLCKRQAYHGSTFGVMLTTFFPIVVIYGLEKAMCFFIMPFFY